MLSTKKAIRAGPRRCSTTFTRPGSAERRPDPDQAVGPPGATDRRAVGDILCSFYHRLVLACTGERRSPDQDREQAALAAPARGRVPAQPAGSLPRGGRGRGADRDGGD